jgi:hypothetical protein
MTTGQYFVWLAQQWGETFLYPPFAVITLILLIGVIASLVRQGLLGRSLIRDRSWLTFALLLTPGLILLVGTVWRVNSPPTEVHSFGLPDFLLFALPLVHGLAYALLMIFLPRSRLFVTCLFLFSVWLSWWAGFLAGMSISEDWV